jgi:hypothetical protein
MRARTVAQVIAAEAGGKTLSQRLSAMRDVASAIVNRALALGVPLRDVTSVTAEFNAYNKPMPPGTAHLTALAEQALADVMAGGVTHNGMFYARSYATKNLPKGLTKVKTAVDDHVYYSDPKGRAIRTAQGFLTPGIKRSLPQTVSAVPQPAPRAAIVSSLRPEFPGQNTAGVLGPAVSPEGIMAAERANGMFTPDNLDIGARIEKAFSAPAAALTQANDRSLQSWSRIAPMEPGAEIAHLVTRPGTEVAASTMRGINGLSAMSKVRAPAEMTAEQARKAGAMFGAMVSSETKTSAAPEGVADPFGNYQPGGALAPVPGKQPERLVPDTAAVTAFAPAVEARPGTQTIAEAISLPPDRQMPTDELAASIAEAQIAPPTPEQIASVVPDQPLALAPPVQVATRRVASARPAVMPTATSFTGLTAGGISPAERFSIGLGAQAMDAVSGAPRGATAYSRSNPGAFRASLGPNRGSVLVNDQGFITPYDASGHVVANRDTMRQWGRVLGSIFGDRKSDKGRARDISPAAADAISRGVGGLY